MGGYLRREDVCVTAYILDVADHGKVASHALVFFYYTRNWDTSQGKLIADLSQSMGQESLRRFEKFPAPFHHLLNLFLGQVTAYCIISDVSSILSLDEIVVKFWIQGLGLCKLLTKIGNHGRVTGKCQSAFQ